MLAPRAGVKDVAMHAGVSVGTVSNVLNHPEAVAPETRARVEASMAALRFVRNASARQLRAGHSTMVGAIVLDTSNPFFMAVARGIEDRLLPEGLMLTIASSDEDPVRERRWMRLFAEQQVRGVLVSPSQETAEHLDILKGLGIPFVLLDSRSASCASVGVDSVSGARQAMTHLLGEGHRRIAQLCGDDCLETSRDRIRGSMEALAQAGLNPDDVLIVRHLGMGTSAEGQKACRDILDEGGATPTAFFCINDTVALGVMRELRSRHLDIPGDVAVVGYDDVTFAADLMPPLTSVRQPMHQLGWTAADLLLSGAGPERHEVFHPELIIRASSQRSRP